MSRDLLSAIGTRLESRLERQDARLHAGSDVAKTNAAISNLIPFTLLEDSQSAPAAASSTPAKVAPVQPTVQANVTSSTETSTTAVMTAVEMVEPESIMAQVIGAGRAVSGGVMQDSSQVDLMVKAQVMASAALSAPAGADAATEQSAPTTAAVESSYANPNTASADVAPVVLPPNYTPAVPAEFYPGATFVPRGLTGSTPMTVTRTGDGVVFAVWTDAEGSREVAFHPNQLDLVTAAP